MNQWINESMNQWITESMNQWINESMNHWITESLNQWINESMNQWNNESMNQWINESMNESINQSIAINQSIKQYQSISPSICLRIFYQHQSIRYHTQSIEDERHRLPLPRYTQSTVGLFNLNLNNYQYRNCFKKFLVFLYSF